jgi:hypothetical protein
LSAEFIGTPFGIAKKPAGIVFLTDKDAAAAISPHSSGKFGRKPLFASVCCERHC